MIVIIRQIAKPYFSQVTLVVDTGGEDITKTLLPYYADSTLTFHYIPPDPKMYDSVKIYTRAKIRTFLFATKVA